MVSGIRSAMLFDCLLAYPIVLLVSLGAVANLLVGLILLLPLSVAGTYLSIKIFYRLHYTGKRV